MESCPQFRQWAGRLVGRRSLGNRHHDICARWRRGIRDDRLRGYLGRRRGRVERFLCSQLIVVRFSRRRRSCR
jgi:hypothetical protein